MPRRLQPQSGPPQIDKANPITQGLVLAMVPALKGDAVSQAKITHSGFSSYAISRDGISLIDTGGTGSAALTVGIDPLGGSTAGTMLVYGSIGAIPSSDLLVFNKSGQFFFQVQATTGLLVVCGQDGTANLSGFDAWKSTSSVTINKSALFGMTFRTPGGTATSYQAIVNGILEPASTSLLVNTPCAGFVANTIDPVKFDSNGTPHAWALGLLFRRVLSASEIASLNLNPWQIFKAPPRTLFSPAAVQLLGPSSDLSAGTWTPSSGPSLFAMLNEAVANDATFDVTSQASTFKVSLAAGVNPGVTTGHIVRYRIVGSQTVSLMQGVTVIASWSQAPTVMTTFAQTLTGVQAALITDYAALSLQFQAT